MRSDDGCTPVAATAPTTPLEGELSKASGRSADGGGYGPQFARQVENSGIGWGQDNHRPMPPAGEAPGGQVREGTAHYTGT